MRLTAVLMLAPFALAACGERTETAAPTPAEVVSAAPVQSDAAATAPAVLNAADLRRVCRAGLAGIHGQALGDITIDGLDGQVVNASWRAPVDGGRRRAQCRVEGDLITWRPSDAADPAQARWMNQSGDPVTRFVLDGEAITINTTLPDGTTATETYAVATEQEAR
ncbi:MAG: hypothetical protein ACK4JY_07575 [Brevundimonas sp.]|uniref:hypothetical protein n=1 Tax=Brevundimonas sp. TaxID=1871086 RepID=UPI003919CCAD